MKRCVYNVDVNFFKNWNSKMAYILGLAFADGNLRETTFRIELRIADKEILYKIREAMKSDYPVAVYEKRNSARFGISNPVIAEDLKRLGLSSKKTAKFPNIPPKFLRHFFRGYLDGDGWIIASENRREISVGFANGNQKFLKKLVEKLNDCVTLTNNHLRTQRKKTKKGKRSVCYSIEWYGANALNILEFLHDDLGNDDLFLSRKYERWIQARNLYVEIKKGREWRQIERKFNVPMKELLFKLYIEKKLNGVQLAKVLGASTASIYRWLEKTGIRQPVKRICREVIKVRCLACGRLFESLRITARYCSLSCAARTRFQLKRTGKNVKCVVCGKEIYRARWWFSSNSVAFCSRTCVGKWQKSRLQANLLRRCKISGRFLPSTTFKEAVQSGCVS